MAKYSRFDPKNKKRCNDKYRSDKRTTKNTDTLTRVSKSQLHKVVRDTYNVS